MILTSKEPQHHTLEAEADKRRCMASTRDIVQQTLVIRKEQMMLGKGHHAGKRKKKRETAL